MPTDSELVARCVKGEWGAYRVLVGRYQGALLGFVRGRVGGAERAEEVAQEALVRAYQRLGQLEKREAFFSWLLGIAERVMRETRRSGVRQEEMLKRFAIVQRERWETGSEGEVAEPDVELERAVAGLGEPYREVVLLRYYGGLSCAEVGERLGMPVGSVTKVLSRAYAMLRERMTESMRREPAVKGASGHDL